jgi:hypothetical protein
VRLLVLGVGSLHRTMRTTMLKPHLGASRVARLSSTIAVHGQGSAQGRLQPHPRPIPPHPHCRRCCRYCC